MTAARFASVVIAYSFLAACGGDSDGVSVTPGDSTIEVRLRDSVAVVDRAPFRITFRAASLVPGDDSDGGGLFYQRAGRRSHVTRVVGERASESGVELDVETSEGEGAVVRLVFVTERTLEVTFDPHDASSVEMLGARMVSPAGEVIYGLTERLRDGPDLAPEIGLEVDREEAFPLEVGSLDRRGDVIRMRVRPTFAIYGPFYQTSRGYGLLVDGTTLGEFDVASSSPQVVELRFRTGNSERSQRLRLYLFDGPAHARILDEYTRLTGRPYVPPDWAFLHWRWRDELARGAPALLDGVEMNAQLVEDVTMYEMLDIPVGVLLFDRPVLSGDFGFARFEWDEERLPHPAEMIQSLRSRGYRLMMWSSMWACGGGRRDHGTEAHRLGYLAPGPNPGTPPNCENTAGANFILDVTHPEVPAWWADKLSDFAARYQIQGIKLDRGEEHIPSEASDTWADGRSGVEVRNDYPTLQARIHHDAMRAAFADDTVVIARSAYTGTQRWAIVWGGDSPAREAFGTGDGTDLGLRAAIIEQQRAAFLGYPIWGSDSGGYYEFVDRDVFARWIEFSAFSGIMEIGGRGTHAPWDMPTEPRFDVEMVDIYRKYTKLRETLLPYLVEHARRAGETGMPIVRPLVFDFADDSNVLDRWDQYMFGPDLMVAPVWRSGDRQRDVYFPAGRWSDYWDSSFEVEGPVSIVVDVPLDTIPVFVRDGASVPR